MKFAVVQAGVVVNVAVADSPLAENWIDLTGVDPQPGPGWLYAGGVFSEPPPPPPPPPIITRIAMITRFTDAEFTGVLAASKTDVEVEGWYARFSAATVINLEDPRTVDGINLLVSEGLLTSERADEILTDPVQPDERP